MADRSVQRRLAAILAADVAGYTRLMEQDTDGTVAAWQDAREEVIKPRVADYSGKIVKLTGDGFLVEFPTVQECLPDTHLRPPRKLVLVLGIFPYYSRASHTNSGETLGIFTPLPGKWEMVHLSKYGEV